MTGWIDDEVAILRREAQEYMPSVGTNSRTHHQTKCRVSLDRTTYPLGAFPGAFAVNLWKLTVPEGEDMKSADVETVTHGGSPMGTYRITRVDDPADYSPDTVCHALQLTDASGAGTLPFTETVTFKNTRALPHANPTKQVQVMLHETSMDLQSWPDKPGGYQWVMLWDQDVRYDDGSLPDAGHTVTWQDGMGRTLTAEMSKPRTMTDAFPFALAFLKEGP